MPKVKKRVVGSVTKADLEALKIVSQGVPGLITVNHMEEERIVPTLITSYNRAMGSGGHVLRRMIAIHGKNSTGKSVLAAGIAESCRRYGHVPFIEEAEWSAESRWLNRLVTGEGTLFKMPADLDELFSDIQIGLKNLERAKAKGSIAEHVGCCFVVDTLTKLIPKEMYDKLITEGVSKSYPLQAAWVSLWSKFIVPQTYRSNSSLVIVLQERQNLNAGAFQKQRKVTLGEALLYDVSHRIECTYSKPIKENGKVVAVQFFFKVEKNKTDGWTEQEGSFFTSTGEGDTPPGFDIAREAIEEAKQRKVIKNVKVGRMPHQAVQFPDEEKPSLLVGGGVEDLRLYLNANRGDLQQFVDNLNQTARRQG